MFGLATLVPLTKNISYIVIHCYFAMSLRLSACITAAPSGQIFRVISYRGLYENLARKLKFGYKRAKMSATVRGDLCTFYWY